MRLCAFYFLVAWLFSLNPLFANEEVFTGIRQFDLHISSGYYEDYEVLPRNQRFNVPLYELQREIITYSPTASRIRNRSYLVDSHRGLRFYQNRQCWDCHVEQAENNHSIKGNITCRQCHGGEPIAGVQHYYSIMNPIRLHAYVCSKCHEGANASFATYRIHEPVAGLKETKRTFPVLYYSSWFMLLLFVGTLAFFVPHTFMIGMKEWLQSKRNHKNGDK